MNTKRTLIPAIVACLIFASAVSVSSLAAAPPAMSDADLQAILDSIEKGSYPEGAESGAMGRGERGRGERGREGRGRGGRGRGSAAVTPVLTAEQSERVWKLYDKLSDRLEGVMKATGNRPPRRVFEASTGVITQAALFFDLFTRMPAESIKPLKVAEYFPGKVPESAKPVSKTLTLDTTQTRWNSTGLYDAPGAVLTVRVPSDMTSSGLQVVIGCHTDNLSRLDPTLRWPRIVLTRPIQEAVTKVANPFGGLVYINVPNDAPAGKVFKVTIDGAVEAPHFILGKTPVSEWKTKIRNRPAPFAELEMNKIVMTLPSEKIRGMDNPTKVLKFWTKVADAQDELVGRVVPRYKERFVNDIQISAGGLHAGYPIMAPLLQVDNLLNYDMLAKEGTWGWFHELGHNHQRRPWNKPGEVTVNIFSMYTMETVVGFKTDEVPWYKGCVPPVKDFYEKGYQGTSVPWNDGFGLPLAMFMHLRKEFGWGLYKRVFRAYEKMPPEQWPTEEQAQVDLWFTLACKAAKRNLAPFYDRWGFKASDEARKQVADLPAWNPTRY